MNRFLITNQIIFRFATVEILVAAVEVLSHYKVDVVDKENIVKPLYGFVTKPEREVWINLQPLQ
jgi:hypothetical protein